jgi:diaminohydroxyphosphoribosylaminopyrimidine deaminase/5-amino-6-(5-phosphoribosylamino)uracil reductase
MKYDEQYMRLAIELAKKGAGGVNPNPLVGAIIVKDDRIIGSGYHARYGDLHAERSAFAALTEPAQGADMYVTLEPCCHYGKQPPCVEAIVEHGISRVYVGSNDPNEKVAGKGIKYLRDHGIEVITEVLKEECDDINRVFFHYITTNTPYVVLKYAMTMDGKIAAYTGESKWITGEASRAAVQESRNLYTGIMVGVGTVIADNPMLTCRIEGGRNPVRIICDTKLRIPAECNIVRTAEEIPTIVAMGEDNAEDTGIIQKMEYLQEKGVCVLPVQTLDGHVDLSDLMKKLGDRQIDGILLEGGGTLNYNVVKAGLVNEVHAYIAPKILGGRTAITPVEGQGFNTPDLAKKFKVHSIRRIDEDVLIKYTAV